MSGAKQLMIGGAAVAAVAIGVAVIGQSDTTPPSPPKNLRANPGTPPGHYCVRATDKAGNVSKPACIDVPVTASRPLKAASDPRRRFDADIQFATTPNVVVTLALDPGISPDQAYTIVRFTVDGALKKTVSKPPYTYSSPPVGKHVITITALNPTDGSTSRIQQTYVKP